MQNLYEETKFLMKKYNISANKSLGQNFLVDDNVVNNIIDSSEISKDDLIIEIGPGLGTLTNILLQKAGKVIAVELDSRMVTILKDRFTFYDNFEIINDDILKIDLNKIIEHNKKEYEFKRVKIVANLPYYITTPIIMKLVENDLDIESITVMIQKEVAERLIAIPGSKETGAITYTIFYYCESKKIREVENTCFIPEPEVTSEVISLKIRKNPAVQVKDKKVMFNIIKSAYMQRRKTLLNSLTSVGVFKTKEQGIEYLKKLGLREDIRPENMKIEDFAKLTDLFLNNIQERKV